MKPDDLVRTRHSLLRRLKDWDDQTSWEDFFNTYWRLIYGVALKAGLSDAEAQDVVQETVLTVAKNIQGFEVGSKRGSFKAWLLRITRWRIVDQFRKRPPVAAGLHRPPTDTRHTDTTDRIPDPASLDTDAVWDHDWEQNLMEIATAPGLSTWSVCPPGSRIRHTVHNTCTARPLFKTNFRNLWDDPGFPCTSPRHRVCPLGDKSSTTRSSDCVLLRELRGELRVSLGPVERLDGSGASLENEDQESREFSR